jgi:hypothetical protein
VVGLALIELLGDLTGWSMHPFYKRRLASAFALRRVRGPNCEVAAGEIPYDRRFGLANLSGHDPQLIVCAAANVSDVYCFDASGDKGSTFATLGQAIETARTDLNVEVSINPEELKLDARTGLCGTDYAIGHITYPDPGTVGHLVYAKAAVTKKAPWDVRAYAQHDRDFPYTPFTSAAA